MIDPDLISRHLIVEKKDEVTSIREVSESNFMDEEVVFNALGYSVFENLRPVNIVFEGWRDKRLFAVAIARLPTSHKHLAETFRSIGRCHAKGARDVASITAILELGRRGYIVLSDSDAPAREQQDAFHGDGEWYRYDQLISGSIAQTSEDFIKPEAFHGPMEQLRTEHSALAPVSSVNLQDPRGRLAAIADWLRQGGLTSQDSKAAINSIKQAVFAGLKPSQVESQFYDILQSLSAVLPKPSSEPEGK